VIGGAGDADPRRGSDLGRLRAREQDERRAVERPAVVRLLEQLADDWPESGSFW